jgi:hypothetical protein
MAEETEPVNQSTSNYAPTDGKYTYFEGPWRLIPDRSTDERESAARKAEGLENPCRQRPKKMWISQEEMHRQKVPLYYRSLAASYVQFIHN